MTGLEKCMSVLEGKKNKEIPVVPQAFLFALGMSGYQMKDVVFSPEKMAKAHQICQQKFGYDGCIIDFDDATIAEACGAKVVFRDDEPAIVDESDIVLKNLDMIDDLPLPDPYKSGRLPIWLETTSRLVDLIGNEVFIMGRADQGPFGLACQLRGPQQFMIDLLIEEPERIHKVLEYCRKATTIFAKAMKDTGAHCTSIGDGYASPDLISPDTYNEFVLEHHQKLTKEVQDHGIPLSIHVCGDTTSIIEDLGKTGASILEMDWKLDFKNAFNLIPSNCTLMGNINPSDLVFAIPEKIYSDTLQLLKNTAGQNLILSSGCALGRNTKPENVEAMIKAARNFPG